MLFAASVILCLLEWELFYAYRKMGRENNASKRRTYLLLFAGLLPPIGIGAMLAAILAEGSDPFWHGLSAGLIAAIPLLILYLICRFFRDGPIARTILTVICILLPLVLFLVIGEVEMRLRTAKKDAAKFRTGLESVQEALERGEEKKLAGQLRILLGNSPEELPCSLFLKGFTTTERELKESERHP